MEQDDITLLRLSEPDANESAAGRRFRELHDEIRSRISLLDYPPGMRLSEEALAEEFGVSRTPLRRVLWQLQAEGLLQSVQGVGTIVTDIDIGALYQVYQMRMELSPLLARLSPRTISPQDMKRFKVLHKKCLELTDNPSARGYSVVNIATFHALADLTTNEPLRETMERLFYQTARIWLKSLTDQDVMRECKSLCQEVRDYRDAACLGDIDALAHLWRAHTSASMTRLQQKAAAQ
ncbi:GntR family transcriptional regulator [Maritalea myrionectae]|uniref:Putative HTH-type transcriptional regulator YdhC n=1 Tax=Maritalea myrionectae TaxID=454601 RepID=A0A2R4MIN1_9HYPH|nr:GntR family transcriptional regulator [Maritalea myrionectae]AVX05877.1 putative HTH-type transcriptional regulator YdhC [Maritalea myrionectae]